MMMFLAQSYWPVVDCSVLVVDCSHYLSTIVVVEEQKQLMSLLLLTIDSMSLRWWTLVVAK